MKRSFIIMRREENSEDFQSKRDKSSWFTLSFWAILDVRAKNNFKRIKTENNLYS